MTFLELKSLTESLLPAALNLDQRCFGGLWTLDGYQREMESPNSELLVLVAAEDRSQGSGVRGQGSELIQNSKFKIQNFSNLDPQSLILSP